MKRTVAVIIAALAILGIVAASLSAVGCGSSSVPSEAVATVGGTDITTAQFQELMTQAKAQATSQGMTWPAKGTATYNHYAAAIVDYLVQASVVAKKAPSMGVTVTDKQVADQVAAIEKQYGGATKVTAILKKQGMTMDLLKQSLRDRALAQGVAAKVVASATVTNAEIQAYWKAHAAQLSKHKATATLAKATATIKTTLLNAAKQKLWSAWLAKQISAIGVKYAAGYSPATLTASPIASPSASASAASGG